MAPADTLPDAGSVRAAARDIRTDAGAALAFARRVGRLLPQPGGGATARRWEVLAAAAEGSLTAARVLEAHADALAILAEARAAGHRLDEGVVERVGGAGRRHRAVNTVSVVVPVADEEVLLPGCLDALDRARAMLATRHPSVRCRVVLVLDGCTDSSELIARHRAAGDADIDIVLSNARCVGVARGTGSDYAIARAGAGSHHWLATTDADSRVPEEWLVGMVARAADGADLVLGTVAPDGVLSVVVATAYAAGYLDIEGHPHVHGANLRIRADVLTRLGGWAPLATGEDHALVAAAEAAGDLTVCRTAALPVSTSTRLLARAPEGFSSHLRGLRAG